MRKLTTYKCKFKTSVKLQFTSVSLVFHANFKRGPKGFQGTRNYNLFRSINDKDEKTVLQQQQGPVL